MLIKIRMASSEFPLLWLSGDMFMFRQWFGSTLADSGVARNDLAVGKVWPTNESESFTRRSFAFGEGPAGSLRCFASATALGQCQGEQQTKTDVNGSVREFLRDKIGQTLHDCVTALAAGIDGAVRRISLLYDNRSKIATVTTWDDATPGQGSEVNQVGLKYNAFGLLITDQQEHDGAIDGSTPEVGYGFTDGSNNVLRPSSVTAPGGKQVDLGYGPSGSIEDVFNRVASLKVNGETDNLTEYLYAGMDWVVQLTYPTPNARLSYLSSGSSGDAGDAMTGYDRFGRTVRMPGTNLSNGTVLADIAYGYDRASRRKWRQDLTAAANGEHDRFYGYVPLGQVKAAAVGGINDNRTAIGGIPQQAEAWDYDQTGNWADYQRSDDMIEKLPADAQAVLKKMNLSNLNLLNIQVGGQ